MITWEDYTVHALEDLGGIGTMDDIYDQLLKIIPIRDIRDLSYGDINTILEEHCSDTSMFRGDDDLFMKIGTKTWQLRNRSIILPPIIEKTKNKEKSQNQVTKRLSLDDVDNLLKTIYQYRQYSSPSMENWRQYVINIFNITGFNPNELSYRFIQFNELRTVTKPSAILLYIDPHENFVGAIEGLPWKVVVHHACVFYRVNWGIICNGISLKIYDFAKKGPEGEYIWENLDKIVLEQDFSSFFELFNLFYRIFGVYQSGDVSHERMEHIRSITAKNKLLLKNNLYALFWARFIIKAKNKTSNNAHLAPVKRNWIIVKSKVNGFSFKCTIRDHNALVDLLIPKSDHPRAESIFDKIRNEVGNIENELGNNINWHFSIDDKIRQIGFIISGLGLVDDDQWDDIQDYMIDAILKIEKLIQSFTNKYLEPSSSGEKLNDLVTKVL